MNIDINDPMITLDISTALTRSREAIEAPALIAMYGDVIGRSFVAWKQLPRDTLMARKIRRMARMRPTPPPSD